MGSRVNPSYLEAFIPANLIYDQFQLTLEIQIQNTAIAHSVITNGAVTTLGTNHWSISFPDRFSALSTLKRFVPPENANFATSRDRQGV